MSHETVIFDDIYIKYENGCIIGWYILAGNHSMSVT